MDICLLGTGGMLPLPERWLTSLLVKHNGRGILIDCGEGTQIAMRERKLSPAKIDAILLTHYHADHVAGLPGLLLTIGNCARTQPLTLVGPEGLGRLMDAVRVIAPEIPFELRCVELTDAACSMELAGLRVEAFRVEHRVTCYGYSITVDRPGRFLADRAKALGIPKAFWGRLQNGETVRDGETVYAPEAVLGAPRKGIKVTYCTDSRPVEAIEQNAAGADLLILEGLYGERDKQEKAREKLHMTMQEAAGIAARAGVPELWLTHYSPAMTDPQAFMDDVRGIFPNAVAAEDGQMKELRFAKD